MSKQRPRAPGPKARRSGRRPTRGRRGLPKRESVQAKIPFVTKSGAKFTIIRTTEKDSYDPPANPSKSRRRT